MDSLVLRRHAQKFLPTLLPVFLAIIAGPASLKATNTLAATPSSLTISCNTATGPGATATITIKPVTALTGSNTIAVTLGSLSGGLVVTPPSGTTLSTTTQTAGLVYTVGLVNGCVGVTNGGTPSIQFKAGGTNDVSVTVTTNVTATTSGLTAPSAITVTCVKSGATYTPGSAVTVSVGSTATGGTPFTVDTTTNPYNSSYITVTPTTGGTPTPSSTVPFSVVVPSGCDSLALGTVTTTIHLLSTGTSAPDKLIVVSVQIVPPTTLTATPASPTLTYVKGSGTAGYVDVSVSSTSSPQPFMSINTATLPNWLTVDSTTGSLPKSFRFSSTSICDTLAPGTYSASVHLQVSGYGDQTVPITLLLTNQTPKLSVVGGTTENLTWVIGNSIPTPVITAQSTDTPIPYSITTGGTLQPTVPSTSKAVLPTVSERRSTFRSTRWFSLPPNPTPS